MVDHSKKLYCETEGSKGSDFGPYWWKVYRYDPSGQKEVVIQRSARSFSTKEEAIDAAQEWLDEQGLDAETVF